MSSIIHKITAVDWQNVDSEMHDKGYAIVPKFLSETQCQQLIQHYNNSEGYRKTIVMERYRFGLGEYKYFDYPLPDIIKTIRENVYPELVPIANKWMKVLNIGKQFPDTLQALQAECRANDQLKPTALILKYGKGGFNTLHQDLYGAVFFPLQAAFFLSDPGVDYTGGEFVLTQQTPRAQSKAIVLKPKKGTMLIFTTNFRPLKGTKGYFRATIKHGVSELHSGERYTLGVIFHDAVS